MHDEKYRYLECGLDDVYLLNGFERFKSVRGGSSVAIRDVDMLHRAIGSFLCKKRKDLTGKEIRFLRREMLMSQATLAHLLEVTEQTVHRWEAEKSNMPKSAESIVRLLYREHLGGARGSIRKGLKRIADLEDELDHRLELIFEALPDHDDEGSSRQQSSRWRLAA